MTYGRGSRLYSFVLGSAVWIVPTTANEDVHVVPPSLCMAAEAGCPVVDGVVTFSVRIGPSLMTVAGGQLALTYDPTKLEFLSMSPGADCDPSSPFTLSIFLTVDESAGTIFAAVGAETSVAPTDTFAMACLAFVARSPGDASICLVEGAHPSVTLLADQTGTPLPFDNSVDCPPVLPSPIISCDSVDVLSTCACGNGEPDCSHFDSECSVGACNEALGGCESLAINAQGPCDDGNTCTLIDRCENGICVGDDCTDPSLCIDVDSICQHPGGTMVARIRLGAGSPIIAAGQFSLSYDPNELELLSFEPGAACDPESPFTVALFTNINASTGEIHAVTTVEPFGGVGTRGPATMACLTFRADGPRDSDVCLLAGVNPTFTILVDEFGNRVSTYNALDCPTTQEGAISCAPACRLIPTLSAWGLIVLVLLLLTGAKVVFRRSTPAT